MVATRCVELERHDKLSKTEAEPDILTLRSMHQSPEQVQNETAKFDALRAQPDLFSAKPIIPYKPCPYRFKYRYRTDDGKREGTCQDWEIETTFYLWAKKYGQDHALSEVTRVFGEEYPSKGMLHAMGTHSLYPDTWLINGVVRLDDVEQPTLF